MAPKDTLVLVTGGSGYLGLHCVSALLSSGYKVRATVRDPANENKCAPVRALCEDEARLQLVKADLLDKECWPAAVEGCDFVLHTASPFPLGHVRDEETLIKPAKEGTLNVLNAVADAKHKVRRVVLTSSVAAINYGHTDAKDKTFTEEDWTDLDGGPDVGAYVKSKTIAERTAWELCKEKGIELATINPGFILGPPLAGNDAGSSVSAVRDFLTRKQPAVPRMKMDLVDVRDVARAHVLAMEKPEAANQRFMLATKADWFLMLAKALKEEFGPMGYNPPTTEAPKFLMKLMSFFDPMVKNIYPRLGWDYQIDNSKMRTVLGISDPIPPEQSVKDMGHALINFGFVPKKPGYKEPNAQ